MKTHYVKAISYDIYLTQDPEKFAAFEEAQAFSKDVAKRLASIYSAFMGAQLGRVEAVLIEKEKSLKPQ